MTTATVPECTSCRCDTDRIKLCGRCRGSGREPIVRAVVVWACPACPNYYASSSAGDALDVPTRGWTQDHGERSRARSGCPDCGAERVRVETVVLVPR